MPGVELNKSYELDLSEILDVMDGPEALLIAADSISTELFDKITAKYTQLQHFQFIGSSHDKKSNQLTHNYAMVNRPSKILIIASRDLFHAQVPSGIDEVVFQVAGLGDIQAIASVIEDYIKRSEKISQATGAVYEEPGSSALFFIVKRITVAARPNVDVTRFIWTYFTSIMPSWWKCWALKEIKMISSGFDVEIIKPTEENIEEAFHLTVHDSSYLVTGLHGLYRQGTVTIITFANDYPDYVEKNFIPSRVNSNDVESYGSNKFSKLLEIGNLRQLNFQRLATFVKLLSLWPELTKEEWSCFRVLDMITVFVENVAQILEIPFGEASEVRTPKFIFCQLPSNQVFDKDVNGYESIGVSDCQQAYRGNEPLGSYGVCFALSE